MKNSEGYGENMEKNINDSMLVRGKLNRSKTG
jgi:hypothetical protein